MFMDIYGSTYTVAMQPYLPYLYALLEYDGVGKARNEKFDGTVTQMSTPNKHNYRIE